MADHPAPQLLCLAVLEGLRGRARELGRAARSLGKRSRTLIRVYSFLLGQRERAYLELGRWRSGDAIDPGRMVWIFGSGRSGSTWLRSMMGELPGAGVWEEPMVGRLFGEFYSRAPKDNLRSADFVMGDPIRRGWIRSVRNFVLDGALYSNPRLGSGGYLIIKEPNGSVGAPLLMEALPESRMILLVRDPRDVIASVLDAAAEGGWLYESRGGKTNASRNTDRRPNAFVRERANVYRRGVESAWQAYDAHEGPKVLVRYEDLRADTMNEMRRIYAVLGIAVEEDDLRQAVERHSWENVPEREKGRGKFYRRGTSGGWKQDLTPKQVEVVEKTTASLLERFYPEP
ncbi:MAG TPA: sulfotransferase domain-containing protein [Rubrobacter sp.]|nr:sulfotransferase domain-containing protein [Rubrobacter sp.]